jgi:hypothetical protein
MGEPERVVPLAAETARCLTSRDCFFEHLTAYRGTGLT